MPKNDCMCQLRCFVEICLSIKAEIPAYITIKGTLATRFNVIDSIVVTI